MKTKMVDRFFRLHLNSNYNNQELVQNRVHHYSNGSQKGEFWTNNAEVLLRGSAVIALGIALLYAFMNA